MIFGGTKKALEELGFVENGNDLPFSDMKKTNQGTQFRALDMPSLLIVTIWKRDNPQSDWEQIYFKPDYPLDDWQIPFDDIEPLID